MLAAAEALRVRNDLEDFAPVRACAVLLDHAVPYVPVLPAQQPALAALDRLLGAWGGRISTKGGSLDRAKTKDLLVRVRSKLGLMASRALFGGGGSGNKDGGAPPQPTARQVGGWRRYSSQRRRGR